MLLSFHIRLTEIRRLLAHSAQTVTCLLVFGLVFLAISTVGHAQPPSSSANKVGAVGFAARIMGDESSTRVLIDFDTLISAKILYMDQPRRIVIELPRTVFSFAKNRGFEPRGLIALVRHGAISKDTTRIVFSLKTPAKVSHQVVSPLNSGDGHRLILDIEAIPQTEFATLIQKQSKIRGVSGDVVTKGDRVYRGKRNNGRFKIVVDPGHGGIDGGASGVGGTVEKDVTFAVALQIRTELEKSGMFDVELTRNEDVFVSLRQRVDFTRRAHADLFISIHADSLSQRHVRGSTIYTLSKKASDNLSARLAESENLSDLVAGLALPEEEDVVTDILVELTARETIRFSRHFSGILTGALKNHINLIKNPQRYAAFGVLKAPEVPSILLELGYLSNKQDEKLMRSEKWQATVAQSVSAAVVKFFKPRLP